MIIIGYYLMFGKKKIRVTQFWKKVQEKKVQDKKVIFSIQTSKSILPKFKLRIVINPNDDNLWYITTQATNSLSCSSS
jgi:hypothetical protein